MFCLKIFWMRTLAHLKICLITKPRSESIKTVALAGIRLQWKDRRRIPISRRRCRSLMSARARRKENSARPSGANEVTFGLNEPLVESPTDAVATDKPTAYFGMGFGHCRGNQAYRNLVLSNQSEYLKSATQRRQIVLDVMRLFRFQQDGAPSFPSRIRNSLTALSYPSRVRKTDRLYRPRLCY
jgi:hypothetical protein